MKSIIKTLQNAAALFLFLAIMLFATSSANAQKKPNGLPWPPPAAAIKVKNPVKADAISIKDGKTLYIKNCKSCHGDAGKGDGTKAGNLDINCGDFSAAAFTNSTDGAIFWKITEGRKPMPAFGKKLTDAERWAVVNYLRTLK